MTPPDWIQILQDAGALAVLAWAVYRIDWRLAALAQSIHELAIDQARALEYLREREREAR